MTVQRIVVGVDGSPNARKAVIWTAELAVQLAAHVTAVHAFEPLSYLGKATPPLDFSVLREQCEAEARSHWCAPLAAAVDFDLLVVDEDPVGALADVGAAAGADLIVVGARGRSAVRGLLLGSTSLKLPHETTIPVCIVHLDH